MCNTSFVSHILLFFIVFRWKFWCWCWSSCCFWCFSLVFACFLFYSHFRLNPCISYAITLPGPWLVPGHTHTHTRLTRHTHTHTNYWITASDGSIYTYIYLYMCTYYHYPCRSFKVFCQCRKRIECRCIKNAPHIVRWKIYIEQFFFSSSLFVRFLLMVVLLLRCYWCGWCCARFVHKKFSATLAKEFKTSAHNVQTKCTMKTWSVWQKWWCNTKTTK